MLFFTSEKNLFHQQSRPFGTEREARAGRNVAPPARHVFPDRTFPRKDPQSHRTAPPENAEAVVARSVAGVEPEAYVHQRIAEGDPFPVGRAVAHAVGQAPVDGGLSSGSAAAVSGEYVVGQRVEHPKFGVGIVQRIETLSTDHKLVVAFDNAGEKTLLAKFAKLTKL